jgi:hypothetical protein
MRVFRLALASPALLGLAGRAGLRAARAVTGTATW